MNTYSLAHLVTLIFVVALVAALVWVVVRSLKSRSRRHVVRGPEGQSEKAIKK
jgi:flagellar biogenesis protein FliO